MKHKRAAVIAVSAVIVIAGLWILQRLVTPKYVDGIVEGAFVAEYYREPDKSFDVVFIGDCEVYENFSPVVLWQDYGIHSYIRGSAEQYIWQSYYLLEDTLRYHTPQVVVFNAQSLQFSESQNEAYDRMSLEGMRWSKSKVDAIFASMGPDQHFLDYVFPILRYHSRWSELEATDLEYLFKTRPVTFNGYYMRVDVRPVETLPEPRPLRDYAFGENAWKYLRMMDDLCREKGITLILTKAPSLWPYWYEQWDEQVAAFAEERGLRYIDFLDIQDETGIDYSTDTYDAGLHMNLSGAEKLSRYIGRILSEEEGVPDRRGDPALDAIWAEETAAYEAEKEAQYVRYGMKEETAA